MNNEPNILQALNDTRDKEDETIFSSVMLNLHNKNLQAEIAEYNESLSTDVIQNVTQNVTQTLTARQQLIIQLIESNNTISATSMAEQLGVTVRSIRRDIEAIRQQISITWIGAAKTGHWEISYK